MIGLDAIVALGGLIFPPVFDFIKKKFLKGKTDSPEATMSTLAVTKPESLGGYVKALAYRLQAETKYFNRDVVGTPSQWVVDLRASIRPVGVILSFIIMGAVLVIQKGLIETDGINISPEEFAGIRYFCETNVCSWFGQRLTRD